MYYTIIPVSYTHLDLIISDVMMPVMDGLEMIRQIKEKNNICHIPIIVLSAKASFDDRIAGLEQGIDLSLIHILECYHILEGNDSFLIQVDQSFIHTQRRRSGGAAQYLSLIHIYHRPHAYQACALTI